MFYIVGSTGLISKQIKKILKDKSCYFLSSRKKTNKILKKIKKKDTIILLSNLGNLNKYEKNKNKVKKFHSNLIANIIQKLDKEIKIIFFSTDMVFSGNKKKIYKDNSKVGPINSYGNSKVFLENIIKKNFRNYLILRLTKVYSTKKIHKTFLTQLSKVKTNYLFSDQKVHYLNYLDLGIIIKKILSKKNLVGTFNVPGKIFSTRYNFVNKYLKKYENNKIKIYPISVKLKKNLPVHLKLKTNLYKKINYYPSKLF